MQKFRGSAPDPAGGLHSRPPDPLAAFVVHNPLKRILDEECTYGATLTQNLRLTQKKVPLVSMEHCAADTFSFVEELKKVRASNAFMVSFDVESLFTHIPLDETIALAVDLILKSMPEIQKQGMN